MGDCITLTPPIDDMLSLPVILAWLRVNAAKIALGGAVFALLAVPIVAMRSETFESTATLLVFPPAFKDSGGASRASTELGDISEMMPQVLPMELYKAIALSPPLMKEVIDTVPLEDTGVRDLQNRLEVELIQLGSRSSQGVTYTQALIFHARATDPESAANIANVWAELFKEQIDALVAKGVGETFALLDALHTTTKNELEQADLALAEHKKAWNLDLLQAQLAAKQTQVTEFEHMLKQHEVDLAKAERELAALEAEAAAEPEKKVYFRAPSDDAYWITGAGDREPAIEPEQGLRHEEANQVYVETRKLAVDAKQRAEGLRGSVETLALKLAELGDEIDVLSATLSDKMVERDKLSREAASLKDSYQVVRSEYEKGRMADRTQASDIAITGQAVAPRRPTSMRSPMLVIIAFILGMVVTGGLLALKEISDMAPLVEAGRGPSGKDSGPSDAGSTASV